MVLQTLFALSSLSLGTVGGGFDSPHDPTGYFGLPAIQPIFIHSDDRSLPAEAFVVAPDMTAMRYPGAVIIATTKTRDRAFRLGGRMAEIGVTVIMYIQEDYGTHRLRVYDAQMALDSIRRRSDVRPDEVGVIAFDEAASVVPDLAGDSTLTFAIVATSKEPISSLAKQYNKARAATLVVHGFEELEARRVAMTTSVTTGVDFPTLYVTAPTVSMKSFDETTVNKIYQPHLAPNITVWPVPREQLAGIGDAQSSLGTRVAGWVKEQVHARPNQTQLSGWP